MVSEAFVSMLPAGSRHSYNINCISPTVKRVGESKKKVKLTVHMRASDSALNYTADRWRCLSASGCDLLPLPLEEVDPWIAGKGDENIRLRQQWQRSCAAISSPFSPFLLFGAVLVQVSNVSRSWHSPLILEIQLEFLESRLCSESHSGEAEGRRELSESCGRPGSYPPLCAAKCGECTPCNPVHEAVRPGQPAVEEYYPEAWRCKCGNKLYMP
ncbi:hypothetical protein ZIOFF_002665 [Zingiber officinale]|uniref:Epidermal patterning factor-like protein n=1 Tax=Zingiber officinale TaxID=94328 RepID=A0A8J5LZB1_ZINOF|nr:hypothetical protein ZIOFF_002665 [Zingiber officinale]